MESSHAIFPPFNRKAFSIESVRVKFPLKASSAITKESALNPGGRSPLASFPIFTVYTPPVGGNTRIAGASCTSQVKTRESFGHTPPTAHLTSLKLATADGVESV